MKGTAQKRTLFLLDDDEDDLDFFCDAVRIINPSIMCIRATRSDRALSLFEKGEIQPPGMIFIDLNMPVMSGTTFLARFKRLQNYAQIPVIVYSTSSAESDRNTMMSLGAAEFLTKPFRQADLITLLRPLIKQMLLNPFLADSPSAVENRSNR